MKENISVKISCPILSSLGDVDWETNLYCQCQRSTAAARKSLHLYSVESTVCRFYSVDLINQETYMNSTNLLSFWCSLLDLNIISWGKFSRYDMNLLLYLRVQSVILVFATRPQHVAECDDCWWPDCSRMCRGQAGPRLYPLRLPSSSLQSPIPGNPHTGLSVCHHFELLIWY